MQRELLYVGYWTTIQWGVFILVSVYNSGLTCRCGLFLAFGVWLLQPNTTFHRIVVNIISHMYAAKNKIPILAIPLGTTSFFLMVKVKIWFYVLCF